MNTTKLSDKKIITSWQLIDAKDKILGRMATSVATILMGKNKSYYVPYLDCGDHVVIINASKIKVTGKKEAEKSYFYHSGYPGGERIETLSRLRKNKPEEIIRHCVWGMVPKTKLGKEMIKKLHVFAGEEHPFKKNIK
ncbi:MAG: 50S ribosomal protein L13 [Candidatus Daviesbacteria bacterium]|nr:50S ribosomal protein L13 [Candidatus Daviesbacteria bacterium]